MAVGSAKQQNGFADVFGGKNFNAIDYSGPSSYVGGVGGGDALDPKAFGFFNEIIALIGTSIDQSGTYVVIGQPVNNGVTKWNLRWFTVVGMTEVVNATNLSGKTVRLAAIGS
jgi:hypothetical protein